MSIFSHFKKDTTPQVSSDTSTAPAALEVTGAADQLLAVVDGKLIDIKEVSDPVFSSEAMGRGYAIIPTSEVVYAPFDGVINASGAPNQHAVALTSAFGCELLIHVGVDTVEMNGKGFEVFVAPEQQVKAGQPLLRFSLKTITQAGFDPTVIVCVLNTENYPQLALCTSGEVTAGTPVVSL